MKHFSAIVTAFALLGFSVGLGAAFYALTGATLTARASHWLLVFCPPAIASMKDQSSTLSAIIVWVGICVANAALYTLPVVLVGSRVAKRSG